VSRIVQSFKHQEDKLEELVSTGLLQAILRLLLPGTTNLIGANIHTMFLQVLAYTAKASPRLSAELLKMNVVDTLYQILTGVSPPSDTDDVATKLDSVVIMQALIHRPKDQVYETLNVICELLPDVPDEGLTYLDDLLDAGYPGDKLPPLSSTTTKTSNEKRIEFLEGCKPEVKRFAVILLPTLTDAYSSTVNLNVRQKVLTAQLKMLSNLDTDILQEALRAVPYASYLASIFSQQDHPTLVTYALQAAELLLKRLEFIYRYQFYREGVISEISHLANRPCKTPEVRAKDNKSDADNDAPAGTDASTDPPAAPVAEPESSGIADVDMHSDHDDQDNEDDAHENDDNPEDDDDSDSSSSFDRQELPPVPNIEDIITLRAKTFIEVHEKDSDKHVRDKATAVLDDLKSLAHDLKQSILQGSPDKCMELFTRLASYFEGDALESITSYELKSSKIVEVLLELFSAPESMKAADPRSIFLEAFMGGSNQGKIKSTSSTSPATPFSVLVNKLQDLLSRSEHFEVITVHQNSHDGRGSATSMLAKQLRLKLVADDDSGIPKSYRNIMVSIHAIATFKALDDYLRPRISAAERPRGTRTSDFAAYAQALLDGRTPPPPQTPSESTSRSAKNLAIKDTPAETSQAGPSSTPREKTRRSSRRQQAQSPPPPPPPPAPAKPQSSSSQDAVECADEERLSDHDSIDENAALDAIVDDLENELEDELDNEEAPDPSAVSVEVAATGKATARKDDGTRIATPVPGTPAAKPPAESLSTPASRLSALLQSSALRQSLGAASGALSYAAAVQMTPQDWHIEFSVNDQPISNETTIYRAVHFNQAQPSDVSHRTVWNAVHTIKFKRVPGPPPTEATTLTPSPESKAAALGMPASLDNHPVTSGILRLLSILHSMNTHLDDILSDNKEQIKLNTEPLSQFVNTKLTAKLNRQLEEPLIVASNCLPSWSEDLARFYPFLFPFESRHLFIQSTSFGYSRSMTRWQNSQSAGDSRHDRHRDERPFLGRLQRQKVRISRSRILESAMKVMQLYGHSPSVLEVEYFEEVGTGLGPTLEFYATVSKEFSKKKLKIWRENESFGTDEYAFGKRGLFPAPMSAEEAASENGEKRLELFKVLGKFVARSMLDSRIIDVSFNPTFFRIGDGSNTVTPSLGAIKSVDQDLAKSLKLLKRFADAKKQIDEDEGLDATQKAGAAKEIVFQDCHVEDLALDFTLPGYPSIELVEKGADTAVTIDNVATYVEKVLDFTLGSGVQRQVDAFSAGFSEVFPYSALKAFTPDELVMLFGRTDEDWSLESKLLAVVC
jgi:E3 ubiquitin-protein ligase TRIP12